MSKPYLADWHHKLFIREMQAKGKLPKYVTEATERKVRADTELLLPHI